MPEQQTLSDAGDPAGEFAPRLRALRGALGLTQAQLAARLRLTTVTISRWESGSFRPRAAAWLQLQALEREAAGRPAASAARAPAAAMPAPPTDLVGRAAELAEVEDQLQQERLVTVHGAGGIGKTRLAVEAARRVADRCADGVWWVDLAPVADPKLVPHAVALALGLRQPPGVDLEQALASYLSEREALLVLDNCEHLVEACAGLVARLLGAAGQLRVLATSREALHLRAERLVRVPPLGLPESGAAASVADSEAAQLFLARAERVRPGAVSLPADAEAVARLCRALDGVPLALELAAARVAVLGADEIADRVDDALRLLSGGPRDGDPRHRSLRAALDWSYELLDPEAQQLFRHLAVFAGGCTLDAVEALARALQIEQPALDLMARLEAVSLVVVSSAGGATRYRLLEPVRQYAALRLSEQEREVASEAHAAYYHALARSAARGLAGPRLPATLAMLDRERDNIRAALRRSLDHGPSVRALEIVAWIWRFWLIRGDFEEGRSWAAAALAAAPDAPAAARAAALIGQSALALRQIDYDASLQAARAAHALAMPTADLSLQARALWQLGHALHPFDVAAGVEAAEQALTHYRQLDDPDGQGRALACMAMGVMRRGELARAAELLEEAIPLHRDAGALDAYCIALGYLSFIPLVAGRLQQGAQLHRESLPIAHLIGDRHTIALSLAVAAGINAGLGGGEASGRLFGASEALRELIGATIYPEHRPLYERFVGLARQKLGGEALEEAWAAGRRMPLPDAVALAIDTLTDLSSPAEQPQVQAAIPAPSSSRLSEREVEVLSLLAAGHSNSAIANALSISARTVERHIANIYIKIGVGGRAAATLYAVRHGMVEPG